MVYWWRWQVFVSLAAFTEGFPDWVMAHFSPFIVRLMYLIVYLTGITFCVYWIARRIFGLNPSCCYLAAILPAIYPTQYQIIAAINSSYTLLYILMVLLALIAGFKFLIRERYSWPLFAIAAGLYAISTRLMEQAVFLSAALGLIYLIRPHKIGNERPFSSPQSHFQPQWSCIEWSSIPEAKWPPPIFCCHEILERGKTFLLYLSPTNKHFGIWLFAGLFLLSFISGYAYAFWSRHATHTLPHLVWLPRKAGFTMLPAFVLLWTIPSVLPFIGMTKYFSVRTLHVAGYGPWLLITPGIYFLISGCTSFISPQMPKVLMTALVVSIIGGAGIQHMIYAQELYRPGNYYFESLLAAISKHATPDDSQIVITNASTETHQSYPACTGYLSRMLANRLDVGGLVGTEYFFYDPFAQTQLWLRPMTGSKDTYDSLRLYRWDPNMDSTNPKQNGTLQPYTYFLRVLTDESAKTQLEKTGDWFIYRLDAQEEAHIVHSGHGLTI